MRARQKLPLGIQNFAEIIEDGYLYIDKTEHIYRMVSLGKLYFLSRPRRFGKSVLITTLAALFEGRRELFRGLFIEDKWHWKPHPVINLSFLGIDNSDLDALKKGIDTRLSEIAMAYGIALNEGACEARFRQLILEMAKKGRVAILIDEYDKPILDQLHDPLRASQFQSFLATFYGVIKSTEPSLIFVLLTGVSKFTRVSIFSDLNNLTDITLHPAYGEIVGYTENEVEALAPYFPPSKSGESELRQQMRDWYNGYSWDGTSRIYNPVSLLNFLDQQRFAHFWFSTGTPRFLIKLLRQKTSSSLPELEDVTISHQAMDGFEPDRIDPVVLMFQTGYLTIKEILNTDLGLFYRLGYPNKEVKEAFLNFFLSDCTNNIAGPSTLVLKLSNALKEDDFDSFANGLKRLFATIPYNIFVSEKEAYYHTVIYLALSLTGHQIACEVQTNQGRIDAVVETEAQVYIMEFKLGDAQQALDQIHEKNYAAPYLDGDKPISLIGFGIDPEARNIVSWLREARN